MGTQPRRRAMSLEALRPSLIASAVCCFEPEARLSGRGTKVARSGC